MPQHISAGESHIGEVGGLIKLISAAFARPNDTTAYAVGDLIANSTAAGSVVPLTLAVARSADKSAMIRKLHLKVDGTAWMNATIRVHLFRNQPVPTVGDNGVFNASGVLATTEASYLGYTDVPIIAQFTDPFVKGFGTPTFGSEWNVEPKVTTANVYALLEARTAVTPAALKNFTLTAEVHQN